MDIGSSLRGAAVRLGVGLVLLVGVAGLLARSGEEPPTWVFLVALVIGYASAGQVLRGGATLVDGALSRLRGEHGASDSPGTHRLAVRDVSAMPRIQAIRVLRGVGLTFDEARATVDGGAGAFESGPVSIHDAGQAARAARRYGAEARAEPLDREAAAEV